MRGLTLLLALIFSTSPAVAQTNAEHAHITDAEPLVRIPPIPPHNATYSGYCCMTFDVSPMGRTRNVTASCSAPFYTEAATSAVKKWTYEPKRVNGHRATQRDVVTLLNFLIADEFGNVIKDSNGFPETELRDGQLRSVAGKHDQLCPIPGIA